MKKTVFIIFSLFLIVACSSVKFHSDFSENTDFTIYNNYDTILWNIDNDSIINTINKNKIIDAVKLEMKLRNINKSNLTPTITISINIIRTNKIGTSSYTDYGGYYGYGYYRPMGYSVTNYYNYEYTEGAIVIDIFDHQTKKLIWQGTAKEDFNSNSNPDLSSDKINYVINKIFQKYPVKQIKN